MKHILKKISIIILLFIFIPIIVKADNMSKKERNYIYLGNTEYKNGNYKEAVNAYRNALTLNPSSTIAEYNLASALLNISEKDYERKDIKPEEEALSYFNKLKTSNNSNIAQKSLFNLGHIAYNNKNYGESVKYYKELLRQNPDNNNAIKYLRMAQMKLKENQDQNKNQNKKNNDEKKQQQNNQDKQDKQENKDNQQNQNEQKKQQQSNNEALNDANADKILKTIENKEQETLMRINQRKNNSKKTDKNANGKITEKPW